jgi:hypothetical protein
VPGPTVRNTPRGLVPTRGRGRRITDRPTPGGGRVPVIAPATPNAARPPISGAPVRAAVAQQTAQRTATASLNAALAGLTPAQRALAPFAVSAAQETGVPASVLLALSGQESNYGQNQGPSSAGARGITQFIPSTRESFIQQHGVDPWAGPKQAFKATAIYLKDLGFAQDPQKALSGYSGGYSAGAYNNPILTNARNFRALDKVAGQGGPVGKLASGVGKGPYLNPYGSPTEIDQGVDYGGTGPIGAIGKGRVVGESSFGGGPYLAYQLLKGPRKGWTTYVAEGISPTVHPGQIVKKGQTIAQQSGGIEAGWAGSPKLPYRGGAQTLSQAQGDPRIAGRHTNFTGTPSESDPLAGRDFLKFLGGKPSSAALTSGVGIGSSAGVGGFSAGFGGAVPVGGPGVPGVPQQAPPVSSAPAYSPSSGLAAQASAPTDLSTIQGVLSSILGGTDSQGTQDAVPALTKILRRQRFRPRR